MNKSARIRELASQGIPVAEITRMLKKEFDPPPAYQMVYQVVGKMKGKAEKVAGAIATADEKLDQEGKTKAEDHRRLLLDFTIGEEPLIYRCARNDRYWVVTNAMGTVVLRNKKMLRDEVVEWVESRIRQEKLLPLDPRERGRSRGEEPRADGSLKQDTQPDGREGEEEEGKLSSVQLESLANITIPDARDKGRRRDKSIIEAAKERARESING
jgi:hypothetical protein